MLIRAKIRTKIKTTIPKARKPSPAYHGQTLTHRNVSTSTTPDNIDKAEHLFAGFLQQYEEKYYRYEFTRLQWCKSSFHLILHIAGRIRWLGPMTNYSEWTME